MIAAAPRGESGSAGERGRRSTSTGAGVRSAEQILDAVRAIPPGFVCTYGDLAPGSPRHAGRVLHGATAEIPWWRVVRADGSLPLGAAQRARLDAEGVPLLASDPPRVDMRRARLPNPASP